MQGPTKKVATGTPQDVGALHTQALSIVVSTKKRAGWQCLIQLEHPLRRAVKRYYQQRVLKREAQLFGHQTQTAFTGTIVKVNDVKALSSEGLIDEMRSAKTTGLQRPIDRL